MQDRDLLQLNNILDELEEVVEAADSLPLTDKVLVNPDYVLGLVTKLKDMMPAEIEKAERIIEKKKEILAEAEGKAEKRIEEKVAEAQVIKKAENKAREIVNEARRVASEIRTGVDAYGDEVLAKVEGKLEEKLNEVRRSRAELKEKKNLNQTS
ncbi:hypothetical protein [Sporohalobacter salinus]|uniref:hypothetical protein n=1 Tax=Sporohalobacter salinus TaxID=1494606 RepID=UPI00196087D5|nr:hypothetical protein [Sporohalobacter salinus]MBM7623330.1 vacuolar-type H+-ATPase subunit H [Sporohalobacter salinus]